MAPPTTGAGVTATLRWTNARKDVPAGGGLVPTYVIRSASVEISGTTVARTRLPVSEFVSLDKPIVMVTGPQDGCGAATSLALIPQSRSAPPYVVAFAVEAQKGCRPLSSVFVPVLVRSKRWRYINASEYALQHPELAYPIPEPPFVPAKKFAIASAERAESRFAR